MQHSRFGRLLSLFAVLLLLATAMPSVFARGSFGGGGRSFGGGGRSFGGGGGFFGGGSRPSFTPPPRSSFTPPPVPVAASRPSFTPSVAPTPSAGSFGRGGGVGNPVSNRFSATSGTGGSFGRSGTAGSRSFTSTGRHDPPPAPVVSPPYSPAFSHPYYYGGRPVNAYFGGGYNDYSFGYYGHPYYGWMPWTPVYYYNPPIYINGGYVSGGFSVLHLLLGIVFWIIVAAVVFAVIKHFRNRQTY